MNYLHGTNRCIIPTFCTLSTINYAVDSSQLANRTQYNNQWFYVSTLQAAKPNYTYQYKSGTERLQALMGRLNLKQCK